MAEPFQLVGDIAVVSVPVPLLVDLAAVLPDIADRLAAAATGTDRWVEWLAATIAARVVDGPVDAVRAADLVVTAEAIRDLAERLTATLAVYYERQQP